MLLSKQEEAALLKSEIDTLKAEIQTRGLQVLEDRNIKFCEFFATDGIASVTMAQKMDILNYFKLKDILGEEFTEEKVKREQPDIKYTVDKKLGKALISIATDDYATDITLDEVVASLTSDTKQQKLLLKKLKGEYEADKKTLIAVLGSDSDDNYETELYLISKVKNYELIQCFFNVSSIDDLKLLKLDLKKCIMVDETVKIAAKSTKEVA